MLSCDSHVIDIPQLVLHFERWGALQMLPKFLSTDAKVYMEGNTHPGN